MPVPESILYLTESDVQRTMTVAEAVDLAEKGIQADAAGHVVGAKFYMPMGGAGFIKPFSSSPATHHGSAARRPRRWCFCSTPRRACRYA